MAIGQAVRAKLNGKIQLAKKLLKQAFSIDDTIEPFRNHFWAGSSSEHEAIDLDVFGDLMIVEGEPLHCNL